MSWSFGVPATPVDEFEDAAKAAAETALTYGNDTPEMREQIDLAIAKATSIVKSGAIGSGSVSASLSGHGVTVSVNNATPTTPTA